MNTKKNALLDCQRRRFGGAFALWSGLALAGCGNRTVSQPAVTAPVVPQQISIKSSAGPVSPVGGVASEASGQTLASLFETITGKMHGFQSGNPNATVSLIVVFDPQCPHCGRVWVQSQRLNHEVRFAWIPVPLMNKDSTTQGAMLLGTSDPVAFMQGHEQLVLSGKGGAVMDPALFEKGKSKIEMNRILATQIKIDSVPMIFHKKANGDVLMTKGGMGAEELILLIQS